VVEYEALIEEAVERRPVRTPESGRSAPDLEVSATEQAAIESGLRGSGTLPPTVLAGLQRVAGNAAVTALIQRNLGGAEEDADVSAVRDVVGNGQGQPLDGGLKEEMEDRLGADFSDVRVHTGAEASRSAAAVSALAYTVGSEVVLGPGSPALDSPAGKRMLAHELTHVVQQRQGPVSGTAMQDGISISDPSDRFEQAAEVNAEHVMGMPVQRQAGTDIAEDEEEEQEAAAPGEAQAEIEAGAGETVTEPGPPLEEAGEEAGAENAVVPQEAAEEAGQAGAGELVELDQGEAGAEAPEEAGGELELEEDQMAESEAEAGELEEEEAAV
jgi:Domain of unknown function (DUF4157)